MSLRKSYLEPGALDLRVVWRSDNPKFQARSQEPRRNHFPLIILPDARSSPKLLLKSANDLLSSLHSSEDRRTAHPRPDTSTPIPAGIRSSLIGFSGWLVLIVNLTSFPITSDTHPGVSDRVLTEQGSLTPNVGSIVHERESWAEQKWKGGRKQAGSQHSSFSASCSCALPTMARCAAVTFLSW